MTITGGTALSKDEIDRMVKEAEAHAEEDRQRREEAEVRNQADTLVFQTEKLLAEQGEKVSADERAKIESALGTLKEALAAAPDAGGGVAAVKAAHEALIGASQEFAQRLYSAAQADASAGAGPTGAQAGAAGPSAADDDEVADAEIVDEPGEQSA
jgi:molecular chaperone DnaK